MWAILSRTPLSQKMKFINPLRKRITCETATRYMPTIYRTSMNLQKVLYTQIGWTVQIELQKSINEKKID